MKQLELTDAEVEALTQDLSGTINNARYPLAPRIQMLREIPFWIGLPTDG